MKSAIMAVMAAVLAAGLAAPVSADPGNGGVAPVIVPSVGTEAVNLYNSGMSYFNGTNEVQRDFVQALKDFTTSAHKGYSASMLQLVTMYSYGYGTPANPALAQYWSARYQRAKVAYSYDGMVINDAVVGVVGDAPPSDAFLAQ